MYELDFVSYVAFQLSCGWSTVSTCIFWELSCYILFFNTLCPWSHGPLARYVNLRTVHVLGMPGTFSPPPTSKKTASKRPRHAPRHVRHVRAEMHVGIANPRWWGKRSRYSQRMRNLQFYVSGKRPMAHPHLFCQRSYLNCKVLEPIRLGKRSWCCDLLTAWGLIQYKNVMLPV